MFNVLLHKLQHHQVLRLPRKLARKAKETSHLTQPHQCGKRQVQSRKCPKYSACHAEWHSTRAGSSPDAAPATQNDPHDVPRLPRNLHVVTSWCSPDNAIRRKTQHDMSKVPRLPGKMTMDVSKVLRLPRKMQVIFWKPRKSIAPVAQNDFWRVLKHVEMICDVRNMLRCHKVPRLKRRYTTFEPPKMTASAAFPTGRPHTDGGERLQTVADGCATSSKLLCIRESDAAWVLSGVLPSQKPGRLRTVWRCCAAEPHPCCCSANRLQTFRPSANFYFVDLGYGAWPLRRDKAFWVASPQVPDSLWRFACTWDLWTSELVSSCDHFPWPVEEFLGSASTSRSWRWFFAHIIPSKKRLRTGST